MPDSVRIHALRIVANEDCRAAVAAALERADWSLASEQEVLFLRRIRVGGALPEIGRLAREQARQTAACAVDGRDARAEQAEAVRFATRADLLACLLRDLMQARMRWFWRGWRELFALPAGAAIVRLMDTEALHWPAAMHRLDLMGEAATLWQGLSAEDAQQLLYTLQQATGWRLGPSPPLAATRPANLVADFAADIPTIPPPMPATLRDAPAWLRTVAASRTSSGDALLRLAIVTWLWRAAPQTLAAADAGERIAQWAGELVGKPVGDMAAGRSGPTLADASVARLAGKSRPTALGKEGDTSVPASLAATDAMRRRDAASRTNAALPAPENLESGTANLVLQAPATPTSADQPEQTESPPFTEQAPARPPAPSRQLDEVFGIELLPPEPTCEAACITHQGGWFLLLNVIALPAVLARLQALDAGDQSSPPTSGWVWLYRLGRAFGGEADPPLARFMAHAAGLPDAAALVALPPLPDEAELARLATQRFAAGLLGAGLFAQPALVRATSSHLDVHFRMADIRLDVRRAALDINPGWLPWLGRVATFHYGDAPELIGLDRHEP